MDKIARVVVWKELSDRSKIDNHIFNTIEDRILIDDSLHIYNLDEKEIEAIKHGFTPDRYYSAFQKMQIELKKQEHNKAS